MKLIKTESREIKNEDKRRGEFLALRKKGFKLRQIGEQYGLSRERVRQVLIPSKTVKVFLYKCDTCSHTVESSREIGSECLECRQTIRLNNLQKKIILEEVFKDKPKWKQEGRERNREIVRHFYDYTCQMCGHIWKPGERSLDIHHLGGMCGKKSRKYDSLKDAHLLLPLCHKCHFNHPEHTIKTRGKNHSCDSKRRIELDTDGRKLKELDPNRIVGFSTHLPFTTLEKLYSLVKGKDQKKRIGDLINTLINQKYESNTLEQG